MITKSAKYVSKTVSSLPNLTHIDKFYWRFIASCCNHIHVGMKDLHKLEMFSFAIENFGHVFILYCHRRKPSSQPMSLIPEEVEHASNKDVKEYFQWVVNMQNFFGHWKELFNSRQCNYDEITAYSQFLKTIKSLAACLNVSHLVCEADDIKDYKKHYSDYYERLHQLLIKRNQDVNRYEYNNKLIFCLQNVAVF